MAAGELTQQAVAILLGIRQPQVSRILKGQFGRRSKALDQLCAHAKVAQFEENKANQAQSPSLDGRRSELISLVMDVWDGTLRDADRVSAFLRAAANLRPDASVTTPPGRQVQSKRRRRMV